MNSIINNEKRCYVCGRTDPLHLHHIFAGSHRKKADEWGCWVWLCPEHHTGPRGVHFNKQLDKKLKEITQDKWEERFGSRDKFIKEFGKSWL